MKKKDTELERLVDQELAVALLHVIDGPGAFSGDWTETWDTPPWKSMKQRMRREIQRLLREMANARATDPPRA
jgi:hypothetical protein